MTATTDDDGERDGPNGGEPADTVTARSLQRLRREKRCAVGGERCAEGSCCAADAGRTGTRRKLGALRKNVYLALVQYLAPLLAIYVATIVNVLTLGTPGHRLFGEEHCFGVLRSFDSKPFLRADSHAAEEG